MATADISTCLKTDVVQIIIFLVIKLTPLLHFDVHFSVCLTFENPISALFLRPSSYVVHVVTTTALSFFASFPSHFDYSSTSHFDYSSTSHFNYSSSSHFDYSSTSHFNYGSMSHFSYISMSRFSYSSMSHLH